MSTVSSPWCWALLCSRSFLMNKIYPSKKRRWHLTQHLYDNAEGDECHKRYINSFYHSKEEADDFSPSELLQGFAYCASLEEMPVSITLASVVLESSVCSYHLLPLRCSLPFADASVLTHELTPGWSLPYFIPSLYSVLHNSHAINIWFYPQKFLFNPSHFSCSLVYAG